MLLSEICDSCLALFCFSVLVWDQAFSVLRQAGQRRVDLGGCDCVMPNATLLILLFFFFFGESLGAQIPQVGGMAKGIQEAFFFSFSR